MICNATRSRLGSVCISVLLVLGLIIAIPAWAADLTVSSATGQQTLADGDTLTVQSGGAVSADNDDVELFSDDDDNYYNINVTAVKGDEETIVVTNGSVTVNSGGSITATIDADTTEYTLDEGEYIEDGFFARAITADAGTTISNSGTLSTTATSTDADDDIHAFTLQITNLAAEMSEEEDPVIPPTSVTNSGTITATASSDNDETYARGITTCDTIEGLSLTNTGTISAESTSENYDANARGIKIGEYSDGTISNSGDISAEATSNSDYEAVARGIQIGQESLFTITNSADGTISATATATTDTYEAKAWGIQLGDQDEDVTEKHSITNQGSISATAAGGDESKATGIQFEDGGTIRNEGTITSGLTVIDDYDVEESRAVGIFAADIDEDEDAFVSITNAEGASISANSTYEIDGSVEENPGALAIKVSDGYISTSSADETETYDFTINNAGSLSAITDIDVTGSIDYNAGAFGMKIGRLNARTYGENDTATASINVNNSGTIFADATLTAGEEVSENAGAFGIRLGETEATKSNPGNSTATASTEVTNDGVITASSTITTANTEDPTGAYGIKTGRANASNSDSDGGSTVTATIVVTNNGSISAETDIAATTSMDYSDGAYGIRAGDTSSYDSYEGNTTRATTTITNSATGSIDATASITSPEMYESIGAYGMRVGDDNAYDGEGEYNVNVSNAGTITADLTLTTDYEAEGSNYNRGAFGIRTGTAMVVNSGSITSTATMNGLNDSAYDGAYGIRTGDGDATVVHSGSISATLTDTDDSTLQRAVGIMTGRNYNVVHLTGSVAATATGGDAYSVVMGCEDQDGTGNALFVMDGASLTGAVLNAASEGNANAYFGLTANTDGMVDFASVDEGYANIAAFGEEISEVENAEDLLAVVAKMPVDETFDFTFNEDFYADNDGWNIVLFGGTTTLNNTEESRIDELAIAPAATLIGNTFVNNLRLLGTVAPGNSIGTITVAGDFDHEAGALFEVEVGSDETSDLIEVSGVATIAEGALVNVSSVGYVADGDVFTILTAGTLTGTYADENLSDSSLFLDFAFDDSVENTVQLVASRTPYEELGLSDTSLAVVELLIAGTEEGSEGADEFMSMLDGMETLEQLEESLGTLLPSQSANLVDVSMTGAALYRSLLVGRMGNLRLASNNLNQRNNSLTSSGPALSRIPAYLDRDQDLSGWLRVMGMTGEQDGDSSNSGFDFDTRGLSFGFDKKMGSDLALGFGFGFSKSDVKFDVTAQNTDVDSYYGSLYGTYFTEALYVDAAISFASNDYDSKRPIAFTPVTATSSTDGTELGLYIGGGIHLLDTETMYFTPTASISWSKTDIDGFTETGVIDTIVADTDADSLVTTLGFSWGGKIGKLEPEFRLAWSHEFGDTDRGTTVSFADGPTTFQLDGVEPDKDSAVVGLGANIIAQENLILYVDYDGEFRSDFEAHSISAGLRWNF